MKKPTPQYLLLGVLLLWAVTAQFTISAYSIYTQAKSGEQGRLPFETWDYSTIVRFVPHQYLQSGLKAGDDIVALDGVPVDGYLQMAEQRERLYPGAKLIVTARRSENGQSKVFDVPIVIREDHLAAVGWTYVIGISVILPIVCLLVGFYIAFARPLDPLAWITMAMLASFGQLGSFGVSWAIWSPWRELVLVYQPLLQNTWPLWMLLFGLYFPFPFQFVRRHRWLILAMAFLPTLIAALDLYGNLEEGRHVRDLAWMALVDRRISSWISILFFIYVTSFFVCLAIKKKLVSSSDARRRLNVMIAGCCLSLTPIVPLILGELNVIPRMPPWLAVLCLLMLLNFPVTMAYVIVVQRAMDVRMVVRMGVQYALASTTVKVLQVGLIVTVVLLTIYFLQVSDRRTEGILILMAGVALIILVGRLARWVGRWTDRRFFREAYNAELILRELSNSVAGIRDTKRLFETVAHRIRDSLHIPRIAVLVEQGGAFQPAYALGFHTGAPSVKFTESTATIRTLKRLNAPSRVYFDDPQSWVHGTTPPEQTALQTLETQVLLPVSLNTRMLGLISLGSKRSEAPYTKADLQLLSAVAAQTGLALENAYLSESIRREIAQRERQERELEIARDVQQRLFPQTLPHVNGLDFAGYCRPALGVGGDYYDFIHLSNGSLGIAVGDVSGKGIAAALMMASLQASLRGQTIKPCDTLSEMIQHINRLVFDASASNRYATFFYAQYDPITRKLRYVNAGHNPPLLRRQTSNGFQFLRLEEGGAVIGVFPDAPYKEAEIELQPGDILVAFTDGISEAMNNEDEEFDEERLMRALSFCPQRSAADITSYILEQVDNFTAGASQHDDMTLVVVRLR